MVANILDGRGIARLIQQEITERVALWRQQTGQPPRLAVVQVGDNAASAQYIQAITKSMAKVGIETLLSLLPEESTSQDVISILQQLNAEPQINGVIVQLPLPRHIEGSVINVLDPAKDVDGIHPLNAGLLLQGNPEALVPATPLGGITLLERYELPIEGRRAVVVGRSRIVGLPMAILLLQRHATVTICHSHTPNLANITRQADILAVAVGRPNLITPDMVRPGAIVIDFGINFVNGEMVGDVDKSVAEVAGYITPVPGGTGPMTNAMLMHNVLRAAERQKG